MSDVYWTFPGYYPQDSAGTITQNGVWTLFDLRPLDYLSWKLFEIGSCESLSREVSWKKTAALYFDIPPDDVVASGINWLFKIYQAVQVKLKEIPFVVSEGGKIMLLNYRGYNACGDIDEKTDLIKGRVIDVNDSITFEGESVRQFKQAFHEAIDSYLEFCEAENREPDKPFSGKISYRTTKERHRDLTIAAAQAGISVNALMDKIIGESINESAGNFRNFNSYAMN